MEAVEHTLFSAALMEEAEWVVVAADAFVLGANEEVAEMRDVVQLESELSLSNVLRKVEHWVLIPEGMREDWRAKKGSVSAKKQQPDERFATRMSQPNVQIRDGLFYILQRALSDAFHIPQLTGRKDKMLTDWARTTDAKSVTAAIDFMARV